MPEPEPGAETGARSPEPHTQPEPGAAADVLVDTVHSQR